MIESCSTVPTFERTQNCLDTGQQTRPPSCMMRGISRLVLSRGRFHPHRLLYCALVCVLCVRWTDAGRNKSLGRPGSALHERGERGSAREARLLQGGQAVSRRGQAFGAVHDPRRENKSYVHSVEHAQARLIENPWARAARGRRHEGWLENFTRWASVKAEKRSKLKTVFAV